MSAPLTGFPCYFKTDQALLAFTAKDQMYKVEMIGSNKNPGCTVDHYITRNMVIKHWPPSYYKITAEQFAKYYTELFNSILQRIV